MTQNFIDFSAVSKLAPQQRFNWLTAKLITINNVDGKSFDGVLYKPENFNPKKKYPIIIVLYEKVSNGKNKFIYPELCSGPINIPLFVSNGYVVFCPDISYRLGQPGKSAYNYVMSSYRYLVSLPWVDSKRIGIQGHSFGGYEVNYIITRTKLFSAAASAAGACDLVSLYGTLRHNGTSGHNHIEYGQARMGKTLWDSPSEYIENSPIFKANKVDTPLFIMHNRNDMNVPWSQGFEFFTALRRLHKMVWLVDYPNEAHILLDDQNKLDYTVKIFQFFNHFLKDRPVTLLNIDKLP